jgi:DMSO reductase anchor subunit
MHPAPSVIVFSTLSGLGFGLLVWLGLGLPARTGWPAFWHYGLGFALAVGGLVSSVFHLGRPERALLAFTQWRSSWLSREAVVSVAALLVTGLHAAGAVFLGVRTPLLGALGAALSLLTVLTTAMIYAQLRTVPRWRQPGTPVLFLTLALAGGALLAGQAWPAALLLLVAGAVQVAVWRIGDGRFAAAGASAESATGLGRIGRVRLFERPHTGGNYLTREMVHVVGRRHAGKLRAIALLAMVALPVLLLAAGGGAPAVLAPAAALHLGGVLVSRWLFFAEAEHVVGRYYGR